MNSISVTLGQWPAVPPKGHCLIGVIRKLAGVGTITLLHHAEVRLFQRDLDMTDVLSVLESGHIDGAIRAGRNQDEWECKVVCQPQYPENKRFVGVVTIVVRDFSLLIKTVEWED